MQWMSLATKPMVPLLDRCAQITDRRGIGSTILHEADGRVMLVAKHIDVRWLPAIQTNGKRQKDEE